jgi:hypothetical protein
VRGKVTTQRSEKVNIYSTYRLEEEAEAQKEINERGGDQQTKEVLVPAVVECSK